MFDHFVFGLCGYSICAPELYLAVMFSLWFKVGFFKEFLNISGLEISNFVDPSKNPTLGTWNNLLFSQL